MSSVNVAVPHFTLSWNTLKFAALPKQRAGKALRLRFRCGLRHETCRPRHYDGTQEDHRYAIQAG